MRVPRGLTDPLVNDGYKEFLDQREQAQLDQQADEDALASSLIVEADRRWAEDFWRDLSQGFTFDPLSRSTHTISLAEHAEIIDTWPGELPLGVREDYNRRVLTESAIDYDDYSFFDFDGLFASLDEAEEEEEEEDEEP